MGGKRQANPSWRTSWWWFPGSRRPLKQTSPRGCAFSEKSVRIIRSGRLAGCVQSCTLSLVRGVSRSEEVDAYVFNGASPEKRCTHPGAVGKPAQRNPGRRYAELGGNGLHGIDHLPGSIDVASLVGLDATIGILAQTRGAGGRRLSTVFPRQPTLAERAPRHNPDPLFEADGDQLPFDLPCQQVVLRLQRNRGGDAQVARGQYGPLELPPCEVGHSDIPNLSGAHEGVERQKRLLDGRGRVPLMRLIEVDVVRIEPAEAALAGANDPSPGQALRVTRIIHAPRHLVARTIRSRICGRCFSHRPMISSEAPRGPAGGGKASG